MPLLQDFHGMKILDIGCASGYVGAALRKQGNYVVGIDITKKDIVKARKVLNKAYVFDIERGNTKVLGKDFDLIIMMEVMEHLFEPELAIKRFLRLLKPEGKIILSTPNIVHIYNRLKFTLGIFKYEEETVVNKSHIHFFTYKTLMDMIHSLNLKILKESHVILPETLNPLLKFWPNLFAHQSIVLAERKRP